jgi:hypothetical protein
MARRLGRANASRMLTKVCIRLAIERLTELEREFGFLGSDRRLVH